MELGVNQLIIHELVKEAEQNEASLFLSEQLPPVDEKAIELVEKLNANFLQKNDILQGHLSSPEDALFPGYFQNLLEAKLEAATFLQFSKDTMNALQLAIQGVVGAKGGYLVYADYQQFDTRILGLFLVRDTQGVVFKRNEAANGFNLDDTTYLDTDRLAMACRIYINKSKGGQDRFVELIKFAKSQKEISAYFTNWIGLDQPVSSRELTQTFLQITSELPLPVDEESGEVMEEGDFQKKVMGFAMRNPEKIIKLDEFNQEFYGESQTTQQFIEENEIEIDKEFRFDQNALKRFFNYRLNADGITLNFSKTELNSGKVTIEDDAIIIRSEALLGKLLDLMNK